MAHEQQLHLAAVLQEPLLRSEINNVVRSIEDWQTIAPEYDNLAWHEWTRHGTCSGMTPEQFFGAAFDLARPYAGLGPQDSYPGGHVSYSGLHQRCQLAY